MTGCGAASTSLWVHGNLFRQLSRDGNLHGSGMSHAKTASPEPAYRAPWRVGDAVVGRGNAGRTGSKSGHPCPCQNCSQGPQAEKTGRGSLLKGGMGELREGTVSERGKVRRGGGRGNIERGREE